MGALGCVADEIRGGSDLGIGVGNDVMVVALIVEVACTVAFMKG